MFAAKKNRPVKSLKSRRGKGRLLPVESLEHRRLLAVTDFFPAVVDNSSGGAALTDQVTNDLFISYTGQYTGSQLVVDLTVGSIFQDPAGTDSPPNENVVAALPALGFDTFVAQGSTTFDATEPTRNPSIGGGAINLASGSGTAQFDTNAINQSWNPPGGATNTTNSSDFLTARITLSSDAQGTYEYLASADGEIFTTSGVIVGGEFDGVVRAPEIDVQANGSSIVSGDSTPSLTDDTDFGDVDTASSTGTNGFTIVNLGNAALNISDIVISGSHAGDFSVGVKPASVAEGGTATFEVTFDPSADGTRSATVMIINDDADEGTYVFTIQGTGTSPAVAENVVINEVDPDQAAIDMQEFIELFDGGVGITALDGLVVVLFNGSNDAAYDAIDLDGFSTDANGFFVLNFPSNGIRNGADAVALFQGDASDFPDGTPVTSSNLRDALVYGTGEADDPGLLSVLGGPQINDTETGSISRLPDGTGGFGLGVPTEGQSNVMAVLVPEIQVQGNGLPISDNDNNPSASDGTDFGNVDTAAGTETSSFTIDNTSGAGTLEISSIVVSGANAVDFALDGVPTSVAAGTTTSFNVTFNPGADGLRSAMVNITNNDPDEGGYNFAIQGTGTSPIPTFPEIDVQGNGIPIIDGDTTPRVADDTDFGRVDTTNGFNTHAFTIDNSAGTATLMVSSIVLSGAHASDFSLTGLPTSVAVGATASFDVTFDPTADGLRTATVTINNNDTDEGTYDFAIQGTGTTPVITSPEIDVRRNGLSIADGDLTPSPSDDTDFGSVDTGSGSKTNTFIIDNTAGTAALTVSAVQVTGANAGDFTLGTIPTTVAAGATAAFNITFDPSADGVRTATLTITNNDADEGIYDFAVQGTGTTPVITSPEIDILGNGLSIADGDPTPSPSDDTDFGSVDTGSGSNTNSFIIDNTSGTAALTVSSAQATGPDAGDFTLGTIPTTVAAGATAAFDVTFDPSADGVRTATLTIANNDADEGSYDFAIQGTGTTPVITSPEIEILGNGISIADGDSTPSPSDDTDFGSVDTGSGSNTNTFTIDNTSGTAALTVTAVQITGADADDFTLGTIPTSVAAGASAAFDVTFDPSADGLRTATVTIANNDADEGSYDFAIQGTGTTPVITVPEIDILGNGLSIADGDPTPSPSDDTDFGSVNTGSGSNTNTFTIDNTLGTAALTVSTVQITGTDAGDFTLGTIPTSVAAGASAAFDVTFDPTAGGLRTATVTIANNDADEGSYDFSIQGAGTTEPVNPPRLISIQLNDGVELLPPTQQGASRIVGMVITFDQVVEFSGAVEDAFQVRNNRYRVGMPTFTAAADDVNGQTIVTISDFMGRSLDDGQSLKEGKYAVKAFASQISAAGLPLEGTSELTPDVVEIVFSKPGDLNGNEAVDPEEIRALASALNSTKGTANYDPRFDFNNDDAVTLDDYFQVSSRRPRQRG